MSADHHQQSDTPNPQPDTNQQRALPKSPFTQALETWDAWSMADTMRLALQVARERGDQESLANFERYPQWTQGPGPLEALRANREVVQTMTGWQWQAIRQAREQGHGWREIGAALQVDADQAKRDYLARVDRQRRLSERDPSLARLLRYDPHWAELAEPNQADRTEPERAELERRALAYDDPGCPPAESPRDNGGRQDGHER